MLYVYVSAFFQLVEGTQKRLVRGSFLLLNNRNIHCIIPIYEQHVINNKERHSVTLSVIVEMMTLRYF